MSNNYRYRKGPLIQRYIAKTGTVAIEQGDMLKLAASIYTVVAVSASTDSTSLVGVAMKASPTTDPTGTKIRMAVIGHGTVFEFVAAASDAYTFGDCFEISGAQELTQKTVVNLNQTASNVVAVLSKTLDASGTAIEVEFLPGRYQKSISST